MHDLHEANKISKIILTTAEENNLQQVVRVVIELGQIIEHGQELQKENLDFNLKMLLENSLASQAEIIINEVVGDGWKLVEIEGE